MFRPCIDLHEGKVKQIVGSTLIDAGEGPRTNFVSDRPASWFAELYKRDQLKGGHIIMLGPGNEPSALEALKAYPGGMQMGGGINDSNARYWLDAGASHVIITSWVFREGQIDWNRLATVKKLIGKERLVLDLSCRRRDTQYLVVTDRWQKWTNYEVNALSLKELADYCAEFLVHAVDVEGMCKGIDRELVKQLSEATPIPTTYAGGASGLSDLDLVKALSGGKVDLTIGSALDIFGGKGIRYEDALAWNRAQQG